LEDEPVADTLDQDVQALKEWLRKAWSYLAQPSLTRFDQQEMRQQMKLVEAKLRIGLQKMAAKDSRVRDGNTAHSMNPRPDWRLLKIDV
jgi:hypothetical protein